MMMNDNFLDNLDSIDESPEGSTSLPRASKPRSGMTVEQKLEQLNELLIDACIENLSSGKIKPNDLGAIVTLLKNNKVVAEKREHSEADLIDGLIK
jgi:hypothetical protein